jgi:DNA-binding transcriptional LysR family regulator
MARYPGITPALQPASTAEQIRAIRARQLDVGVIWETVPRRQGDTDLDRLVLREDPTQLSLAPTHPLAHRKRVSLERLSDELLLLAHRRENPEAHDDVIAALKRNHVRPRLLYSDGSAIIDLVAAGVGVSFISAASPHMRRADIVSRPLNPSLLTIQMVMVWEQGNSLPALQGFLEVVAEMQEAGQVV